MTHTFILAFLCVFGVLCWIWALACCGIKASESAWEVKPVQTHLWILLMISITSAGVAVFFLAAKEAPQTTPTVVEP